jgi:hypothetical protein
LERRENTESGIKEAAARANRGCGKKKRRECYFPTSIESLMLSMVFCPTPFTWVRSST